MHELWRYAGYFYERAKELTADLKAKGRITNSEAQVIFDEQKRLLASALMDKLKVDATIEILIDHLEREIDKGSDPDKSQTDQ